VHKFHDIFGPGSNPTERIVEDYKEIERRVTACRSLGLRIGLTSGTFDVWHEGHARYLETARQYVDVLIVGVDNDEKVRNRKGEGRPVVAERDRMEILCHSRHADLVFLKKWGDPKWQLIKTVRPDVLVATQGTYKEGQLEALQEFCKEVIVLPPQAATSTTARIRTLLIGPIDQIEAKLAEVQEFLHNLKHGGR